MVQMVQDFILDGSALKLWTDYWLAVVGFVTSAIMAAIVVETARPGKIHAMARTMALLCVAGALPLAMDRVGIGISKSNYEVLADLNIVASIASVFIGLPYLMSRGDGQNSSRGRKGLIVGGGLVNIAKTVISRSPSVSLSSGGEGQSVPKTPEAARESTRIGYPAVSNEPRQPLGNSSATVSARSVSEQPAGPKFSSPQVAVGVGEPQAPGTPAADTTLSLQQRNYAIGRSEDSDLRIAGDTVSWNHAQISFDGQDHVLTDLNSTNGTYVNGSLVSSPTVVGDGTKIQLGDTSITLKVPSVSPKEPKPDVLPAPKTVTGETGNNYLGCLIVKTGSNKGRQYVLENERVSIGRSSDNDIVISDALVGRMHARIIYRDGVWKIYDCGSSATTRINGEPVKGLLVDDGSVIELGKSRLVYHEVDNVEGAISQVNTQIGTITLEKDTASSGILIATSGPNAGSHYAIQKGQNLVGREPMACDVVLTDPEVSREHCVIALRDGEVTLRDLGSSAGTRLANTEDMPQFGTVLENHDTIQMGKTELIFLSDSLTA